MKPVTDSHFQTVEAAAFARTTLRTMPVAMRSSVVNRTHRVVRERAKAMQDRRSRDRSLMAPLTLCAVLLTLSVLAVWTGLYQNTVAEADLADLAALATADLNNHSLVVLLWFVPVSLAVLAIVWVRRSRDSAEEDSHR